jgi:hypothetical protein
MPHIFISYASEDRAIAQTLAEALQQEGWTVWWDRKIPVGKSFHEVIENAIDQARCVIVIWTGNSVESDWVRNEADEGNRRSILVPVRMGEVRIPLGFRHLQAADLQSWCAGTPHAEYEGLLESIRAVFGQPAPGPKPKPEPVRPQPRVEPQFFPEPSSPREPEKDDKRRSRKKEWMAAGIAAAVIGGAIITAIDDGDVDPPMQQMPIDAQSLDGGYTADDSSPAADEASSYDAKAASGGQRWSVQWRDHAVRFDGTLTYSGGSAGQMQATLHDLSTGDMLGDQTFPVQLQSPGANQYLISGQVLIPDGDSTTAGQHTHAVFIQLQQHPDGSIEAENCTMQGCFPAEVTQDAGGSEKG